MKILIIYFVFFIVSHSFSLNKDFVELLKNEAPISQNQILIAIYQNTGSCSKCFLEPMNKIEMIFNKFSNKDSLRLLSFVECKRKSELKLFRDRYNWIDEFAIVNKGDVKEKLGIPQNSVITVFNDKYEIIINITDDNLHLADSLIYEKIKR